MSLILFYQSYNLTLMQMLFKMKTECQSYYCLSCLGILSTYRFDEIAKLDNVAQVWSKEHLIQPWEFIPQILII